MTDRPELELDFDAISGDVSTSLQNAAPAIVLESLVRMIQTARRARAAIEKEGELVSDGKNNPIAHPLLAVERDAHKQIREALRQYAKEPEAVPLTRFEF